MFCYVAALLAAIEIKKEETWTIVASIGCVVCDSTLGRYFRCSLPGPGTFVVWQNIHKLPFFPYALGYLYSLLRISGRKLTPFPTSINWQTFSHDLTENGVWLFFCLDIHPSSCHAMSHQSWAGVDGWLTRPERIKTANFFQNYPTYSLSFGLICWFDVCMGIDTETVYAGLHKDCWWRVPVKWHSSLPTEVSRVPA